MSRALGMVVALAAIALPQAVSAQDKRSVDDYVCMLSGDCAPAAAPASAARQSGGAETQRFSLVAPRVDLRLSFNSGSATLTPAAAAEARTIAAALKRPGLAAKRFRIEGHTDSVGGRAGNLRLSQRRADAVAAYLARQGVARTRLVARGYGYDKPLPGVPSSSAANRRVEAVAIP